MSVEQRVPRNRPGVVSRFLVVLGLALMLTMSLSGSASAGAQAATIDSKATLTSKTSAVVTGTVVCTDGENQQIFVNLYQVSGKANVFASGYTFVPCTGDVQAWAVTVNVSYGPGTSLKKGPANAKLIVVDFPVQITNIKLG